MASILTFFFTLVSFVANVKENSWEFGVLRAIGVKKVILLMPSCWIFKKQMTKIYMFESLSLILGAALLGSIIGLLVSYTMTAQFLIFTELPFTFSFPTFVFCSVLFMCITTAILASYYSTEEIKKKPIANVLRGLLWLFYNIVN